MLPKIVGISLVATLFLATSIPGAAQEKKRTGKLIGEIKSSKVAPNGKNQIIEVVAAGEEKARSYRVQYDKKANGPIPDVLKAVKDAKLGDRAQLEWIDTGEGLAITAFEVLKKKEKE